MSDSWVHECIFKKDYYKGTIMKKLLLAATVALLCSSCDEIAPFIENLGLTSSDIDSGLKMALQTGFEEASDSASQSGTYWGDSVGTTSSRALSDEQFAWVRDQIIQIALPEDVNTVLEQVEHVTAWSNNPVIKPLVTAIMPSVNDLANAKQDLWKGLNNAAEAAAPQSKTVFVKAITSMTLADGKAILFPHNGNTAADSLKDSTAATSYLHGATHSELTSIYAPIVDSALSTVGASQLWETFRVNYSSFRTNYTDLYSTLLIISRSGETTGSRSDIGDFFSGLSNPEELPVLDTSLAEYTTGKALDGLFHLVGGEEVKIRRDPIGYVSQFADAAKDIIKEVFTLKEDEVQ